MTSSLGSRDRIADGYVVVSTVRSMEPLAAGTQECPGGITPRLFARHLNRSSATRRP